MTHNELNRLMHAVAALPPEQMRQLRDELERMLAASAAIVPPAAAAMPDPLLGLMSDHAELMDEIVEDAMRNRERQPWRLNAGE
jgi:hypothetical protein